MAIPSWLIKGAKSWFGHVINWAKAWFGHFSREELKKFVLLGIIYGIIIGIYWTLRVVKDSVFMSMVGSEYRGYAKLISLLVFFPFVIIYSKALERFPRHRMIYVLASLYALLTIVFGFLFLHPVLGLSNTNMCSSRLLGWVWYVFIESYGSFMPALFWAFATDITDSDSARRGFPFAVMVAQALSTLGPWLLTPLAGESQLGTSAYVVLIAGAILFSIVGIIYLFMHVVSKEQMIGYKPAAKLEKEQEKKHVNKGFLQGLKLLASQPYLFGIFILVISYEIIVTLIDFNFKNMVSAFVLNESARTVYLGENATWINIVSTLCLLFGASNIQRRLGLRVSLLVMPMVVGFAMLTFHLYPAIHILFWVMVITKGLNYAINSPSIKQLYVPTSVDVKYQSQAWIDTFGARGAKAVGSGFTGVQVPLGYFLSSHIAFQTYLILSALFSGGLLISWILFALYLGKTYKKAVENRQVIC